MKTIIIQFYGFQSQYFSYIFVRLRLKWDPQNRLLFKHGYLKQYIKRKKLINETKKLTIWCKLSVLLL